MDDVRRIRYDVLAALPSDVRALLPPEHQVPATPSVARELTRFFSLLKDYPNRTGKTLRGRLLLLSAQAHGLSDETPGLQAAQTLAAALELFQNWVLVHDDIEDDSEERRGLPALHRTVGMPLALNVGDAMHVAMWQLLQTLPDQAGVRRSEAIGEFGSMIMRTAAGQHLDLAWVSAGRFDITEADYLAMVTLKTAYYTVVAPLRLGAWCAGVAPSPLLEEAGIDLGVAFQIRDDVLNLTEGAALGKEFAGDLYEGKRTLMLAHLLANAPTEVAQAAVSYLSKPRSVKDSKEVSELLEWLHSHGSVEYAQAVAESRLTSGLEHLQRVLEQLPNQRAADSMLALVSELAARSS